MKLPKLAIENYQFTLIVIILLVLSGVLSFFTMPYSENPLVSKAGTSVVVIYPGASPTDMEQLVIEPVEEVINELEDIKVISSSMEDGIASIGVEFEPGSEPDEKYSDVVEKVNTIRNQLPEGITSLDIWKWGVSDVNILQMAIVSETASYSEMEKQAEQLEKKLNKVNGVKESEIWAFPEQEVRITLNLDKMSRMRISLNQLFQAIQAANMNIPGGSVDIDTESFNIKTSGSYQSLEDIRNTVIHSTGRRIIYLKDVASVHFDYKDREYIGRFNGRRAVFVTANQKEDTNIFRIFGSIRTVISEFEEQLPESMILHYVFDQSKSVANNVRKFGSNLIQGIIIVGIVVFLSLSFRAAVTVMLVLPISIVIGIGFVDLTGYGIQQMTIAGLVIALGILVDNAIVVTENSSRFLQMGFDRKEAAIKGSQQIGWAIVSATATTVLAFVPIIMIQDITGDFIRSMPVTVIYTLTASLFVALTLTPYLSSRFLNAEKAQEENKIQKFQNYFIQHPYRSTLNYALSHGKTVIFISLTLFLGSLVLAYFAIYTSLFPKAEKPQFIINVSTPKGTNLDKTDEVARYVESVLSSKEEIKRYATNVGHGNPRIYYNVFSERRDMTYAQFYVELKRYDREEMSELLSELREEFSDYSDREIHIDVKELEQGSPIEAPIAIRIVGENLDILGDLSNDVEDIISSTQGAINVENPLATSKMDLHVKIDRQKAGMLGISLVDIDKAVRTCMAGMPVSQYRDSEGEEYDITVRLPVNQKTSVSDFDKIYITSITGFQVPLKQLASIEFKPSAQMIIHRNLDRSITVTADVPRGYSTNEVTQKIVSKLEKYDWPPGYYYSIGGEAESREQSFGGMERAIIIAMIGVFAVLVLQFKSFSQPLIVFSALPFAVFGSIIALFITGYTFSFTAFVGLTSLVGIVVNNSIILVDYTNQLRQEGKELISALKEAGETRFRPIIFTTVTTIGGLLPLTLRGGTLWAPMGWTIIGGLITSTALTLVIVPVLYKIFSAKS